MPSGLDCTFSRCLPPKIDCCSLPAPEHKKFPYHCHVRGNEAQESIGFFTPIRN
nr:MAG TPA: hypothetical protein [Caudoviricetes sp.]